MKRKIIMIATVVFGAILILGLLGYSPNSNLRINIFKRVRAIGTPDAYGNVIMNLTIHQWDGDSWELLQTVTTDTNWTQRVVDSQPINITVCWRLNNTLASSEAEAVSYTRVYINLTDGGTIWNNEEMNNTSSGSDASYYYGYELAHWNQTGLPTSGVTYDVATRYEAYY